MDEEKLRKIAKETLKEEIDSTLIYGYIQQLEQLVDGVIKKLPFDEGVVTKENLLEWIDFFISEWDRLEDVEDRQFELSALNYIHKREIRKIKERADMDSCYQYKDFYEEVCKLLEE